MNAACKDQGFRRARVRARGMSDFALSGGFGGRGTRMLRIAAPLRRLFRDFFDPYRPELHYMRGPGPKWREKHVREAPDSAPSHSAGLYETR